MAGAIYRGLKAGVRRVGSASWLARALTERVSRSSRPGGRERKEDPDPDA